MYIKKESTQPIPFERYLVKSCGKSYKQVVIICLTALKSRFVSYRLATFIASMDNDISLFGVGKSLYGSENATAIVSSVTRVNINVKRAKAEGTVIS